MCEFPRQWRPEDDGLVSRVPESLSRDVAHPSVSLLVSADHSPWLSVDYLRWWQSPIATREQNEMVDFGKLKHWRWLIGADWHRHHWREFDLSMARSDSRVNFESTLETFDQRQENRFSNAAALEQVEHPEQLSVRQTYICLPLRCERKTNSVKHVYRRKRI